MRNIPIPEHTLLDFLITTYQLKNNRALARHLEVTESTLSKIRYGMNKVSGDFVLNVYDKTDLSLEEIRNLVKKQNGLDASAKGAKINVRNT